MDAEWRAEIQSVPVVRHALAYARKGWKVLPLHWPEYPGVCSCPSGGGCDSPGKHPLLSRGTTDASDNPRFIEAWWRKWPLANVGVATGERSGVVVLDVDADKGGRESLAELIGKHGRPPDTVVSLTGGGGRHIVWRHFDGARNRVSVLPGIDVRSGGGQIVAPPSMHGCGDRYRWHPDGMPGRVKIAEAPEWFKRMVIGEPQRTNGRKFDGPKPRLDIDALPVIAEGGRNDGLFRLACRFAWEEREDLDDAVRYANQRLCQPPLSDREVVKILQSIRQRGYA